MSHIEKTTVPAAFADVVSRQGEHLAVIGEDGTQLTYNALDEQRLQVARALIAAGISPGDTVAVWAPNCVEWVIIGLAIHSVGAALVPVNTRMRGPEVAYVLEKSGARLLFCVGEFLGHYYPELLGKHCPDSVEQIVVLDHAREADTSLPTFVTRADNVSTEQARERAAAVGPDATLDIMFTSGTTGAPKGVITHHGQNLRVIEQWCERMAIAPQDRYLIVNPFFHSFGYKVGWLGGLLRGCTILPHAVFDADAVMQRIEDDQISVLPGPPTLFIGLLKSEGQFDLSSLRATITGAAAVAPALIERIREQLGFDIVLTAYGLTESCGVVSICHPDDSAETIARTIGQPIPDTEVEIADTQTGKHLPTGETGEIIVRGYNVMQGYLDNPQATAESIDADGFLHTGDIGLLDEHGYLKITDRLKDMYITGGFNCYPAEIENRLSEHPAIAQIAVIGVPDARMGEVGKACIVLQRGEQLDADALIAWCRQQMANYKVPRHVEFVEALPTNASGKVLKFELRQQQKPAS